MSGIVDSPTSAAGDVAEGRQQVNASPEKVYRMAQRGEIPAFKVGREWRFFESKVLEHLQQPRDPWAQSHRSASRKRVA